MHYNEKSPKEHICNNDKLYAIYTRARKFDKIIKKSGMINIQAYSKVHLDRKTRETRIWHVPAKHANRMDARAHSSTLAECAPKKL